MTDCPAWEHDSVRGAAFRRAVREVYSAMVRSAALSPLRLEDPAAWHGGLFRDFVPLDYYAGNYRQLDPQRICLAKDVLVGGNPGVPYRQVVPRLAGLIAWHRGELAALEVRYPALTQQDRALRLSQLIAVLVGEFVRIHPFINGNGRTSRLLWAWALRRAGLPMQCRISFRPTWPYSDLMLAAMRGDFGPLALHILHHIATAPTSLAASTTNS